MSKPTLRIARKWKWAAKDATGYVYLFKNLPHIIEGRGLKWTCKDSYMMGACQFLMIPGPWRKSLHKRVGDEWVRVDK